MALAAQPVDSAWCPLLTPASHRHNCMSSLLDQQVVLYTSCRHWAGYSCDLTRLIAYTRHGCCHACYRSMVAPDTNKYFVTIEPGVDAAFVVALATLCDEMFHD